MKFHYLAVASWLMSAANANTNATATTCKASSKVKPKLVYDFSINLHLGLALDLGIDIWDARQSYLPVIGGTFCTFSGVTGTVLPTGSASYYQVQNGTGPYKLELEYVLKTADVPPAYIKVKQWGWEVNFVGRTNYQLETGDVRYAGLVNTAVWMGVETGYVNNGTGTYSSVDAYLVST